MAEVKWPRQETSRVRRFAYLEGIPYLVCDDGSYPEGINAYLFERVRGSVSALVGGQARLVPTRRSKSSAKQIAFNLCDLVRWGETVEAHPDIGIISWSEIKHWHIIELYQDSLNLGYWTEAFFRDRHPFPLDPSTIRNRISEALRCFAWMESQGYVENFGYEPSFQKIQISKESALLAYHGETAQIDTNDIPVRSKRVRQSPGNTPLPSLDHLADFFEIVPNGALRLAVMQLFETGMRVSEVINNTLLPDRLHDRAGQQIQHSSWPRGEYRLEYSLGNDRMIGVIPPAEIAWDKTARRGYQCEYRIIGKGPKIRKVNLPPKFLRILWNYIITKRNDLEDENRPRGVKPNAYVYLNRFGEKLQYQSVIEACNRANKKLGAPLDLTPHSFRHAYACYFLETALRERALSRQIDAENLSLNFIQEEADIILMVIQEELGHAEFETTQIYLKQVILGRIGLSYHDAWNRFLDGIQIDE